MHHAASKLPCIQKAAATRASDQPVALQPGRAVKQRTGTGRPAPASPSHEPGVGGVTGAVASSDAILVSHGSGAYDFRRR
jgi:hypothetical protein